MILKDNSDELQSERMASGFEKKILSQKKNPGCLKNKYQAPFLKCDFLNIVFILLTRLTL